MPNKTQLDQRVVAASRSHIQALRDSAKTCETKAADFDALAKLCTEHGSEAGELLADIAKGQATEMRLSAAAELRRADHIVRYSA